MEGIDFERVIKVLGGADGAVVQWRSMGEDCPADVMAT